MITSKGRKKSFWKRKLANSPFSINFMESCRRESIAKKETSSLAEHPTRLKCSPLYDSQTNIILNFKGSDRIKCRSAKCQNLQYLQYFPNSRPLETNATHVVVWDFNQLLQAKHSRVSGMSQFIRRYLHRNLWFINIMLKESMQTLRNINVHTWHKALTKSTIASPSSRVDPVNILSTATTTLWELVSPIDSLTLADEL